MPTVAQDFADRLKKRSKNTPSELEIDERVLAITPLTEGDLYLFVGHDEERDSLLSGVDACLRKVFRKMIIYGEPGVGKTSLASVASQGGLISDQYRTIYLGKTQYVKNIDACYDHIIYTLCGFIYEELGNVIREKPEYALMTGCNTLMRNIALENHNSEEEIVNYAKKQKWIEDKPNQITRKQDVIKALAKKIKKKTVMLIIDDVHEIYGDRVDFQELIELSNIDDWFSLFIMHTNVLNELKIRMDPLTKDAFVFEVKPLSMIDCKEMLRRRLLYSKGENKKVERLPNYSLELLPFSEIAVEIISSAVNYTPLLFIKKLKDAIVLARQYESSVVNEEIAMRVITKDMKTTTLTPRLKKVLDFIREKRKVSIQDVANMRGKGRISAYFILKELYDINLLDKKREGRKMFYVIKSIPQVENNIISTGKSHIEREKVIEVMEIIKNLSFQYDTVEVSMVIEEAKIKGIDESRTRKIINELAINGDIYYPKREFIKLVTRD